MTYDFCFAHILRCACLQLRWAEELQVLHHVCHYCYSADNACSSGVLLAHRSRGKADNMTAYFNVSFESSMCHLRGHYRFIRIDVASVLLLCSVAAQSTVCIATVHIDTLQQWLHGCF
jgi:hypothetical protein